MNTSLCKNPSFFMVAQLRFISNHLYKSHSVKITAKPWSKNPASFKATLKKDSHFLLLRSLRCRQVWTEQDLAWRYTSATNCGGHREVSDPTCSTSFKISRKFFYPYQNILKGDS